MPAFFAAASKGAGIDFAAALGAAAVEDATFVAFTVVCVREATEDFTGLLDGGCFADDGGAEVSALSSSLASRKASASFRFLFEAFVAVVDADEGVLLAWLTGAATVEPARC